MSPLEGIGEILRKKGQKINFRVCFFFLFSFLLEVVGFTANETENWGLKVIPK